MALLLDTTVVIDLLRGRPVLARLARLYAEGEPPPYICAVVAEEVERGMRPEEAARTAAILDRFRVVPLGVAEGVRAGAWRRDFAARGVTLGQGDCLIAAAAYGAGARLVTGNPKDFPMDEVAVEHWPVGE